ncbi:MAG: hypothetical protein HRF40_07005 [Nitrososphaera sp.]
MALQKNSGKARKERGVVLPRQQQQQQAQQAVIASTNDIDDVSTGSSDADLVICGHCGKQPAEIFQVTGDYCIGCWQEVTHSRV